MGSFRASRRFAEASLAELEKTHRERYSELLRVATAISGSSAAGQDAVHDAFVGLIRARRVYRHDGRLEARIWAAVVNAARRQTRLRPIPGREIDDGQGALRAAISRLPERQRLTLFLRYYADLDYATTAEALNTAPGTIAATLYGAHKAVRQALEEVKARV